MRIPAIEIAVQAGVPVNLVGEPGTGKTEYFKSLMRALSYRHNAIAIGTREPVDFAGQQWYNESTHRVDLLPIGKWCYEAIQSVKDGVPYRCYLDEYSTAPPAVQAASLKMMQENIIGDVELPARPMFGFIVSMNPADCAANGWNLSAPAANRMWFYDWKPSVESWVTGMLGDWPAPNPIRLPQDWHVGMPSARALIASFIQTRPAMLQSMPDSEDARGRAWPSRRTWEMAATLLCATQSVNGDDDLQLEMITGAVGMGAAVEFCNWKRELDLPNPEDLLRTPKNFRLPRRGDQTFAVLSSVTAAVIQRNTAERWTAAWEILAIAVDAGAADIAAVVGRQLADQQYRPKNVKTPECVTRLLPIINAAKG